MPAPSTQVADHEHFRQEVREFTGSIGPEPEFSTDEDHFQFLVEFQQRLNAAGLTAVAWPSLYGGRDLTPKEYAIVCEELGRARAPELINFVGIDVLAPALMAFCRPEQLRSWLPPMAAADHIWCQLFSEPDAGSDLTDLRTRAKRVPGGWSISGQKVWSTWAQYADFGVLLARTGTQESRHRGISAFVVDMANPAITVRPLRTMTGVSEFAEVFFDDARLPDDSIVGVPDEGWKVAQLILMSERGPYAIRRAAVLRGALSGLRELAVSLGHSSTELRRSIVDAVIDMRLLDLRIANVVDQLCAGHTIGNEAAITKLLLARTEQRIFTVAMGLLGSSGSAWDPSDHPISQWVERYLYSRASTIYGGTWEIQHNIIGERLLGLPREPRIS